jgi:hypothetical protein
MSVYSNIENTSGTGVDTILATKIMRWLDIEPEEFQMSIRFDRFKEILSYMSKYEEPEIRFLIHKATTGKTVDKLTHMWEYTKIREQKESLEGDRDDIESRLGAYGEELTPEAMSLTNQKIGIEKEISLLNEEIAIYEK